MRLATRFGRHLLVVAVISGLAAGACMYANPYSLHHFTAAAYPQFNTPPGPTGVVSVAGQDIDFRLPEPTLSSSTIEEVRRRVSSHSPTARGGSVAELVRFVREHLDSVNTTLPKAATTDAEVLLRHGRQLYCYCSEHAIVLNEVLQACGYQSRVLWLEGHVVTEYFDEPLRKWVLLDAHLNIMVRSPRGELLSVAETVRAMEQDAPTEFMPIVNDEDQRHATRYDPAQSHLRLWYRNVLLNGDCYTLSGSTLQYPSRWTHLLKFRAAPQVLVLATAYNSTHTKYVEAFSVHKLLIIAASFVAAFYAMFRPSSFARIGQRLVANVVRRVPSAVTL